MSKAIREMVERGYPLKIIGNDGYIATLVGRQDLIGGDYEAVYRYPGGDACHDLMEIKRRFKVFED